MRELTLTTVHSLTSHSARKPAMEVVSLLARYQAEPHAQTPINRAVEGLSALREAGGRRRQEKTELILALDAFELLLQDVLVATAGERSHHELVRRAFASYV